MFEDLAAEKTY